jgi:hypothetical protein
MGIRVTANQRGYYDDRIRNEGDVFEVKDESELSFWLDPVDELPASKPATRARKTVSAVDSAAVAAPVVEDGVNFAE